MGSQSGTASCCDEDDDDATVATDVGGASGGGQSELGEAVLDVTLGLVRLSVLLHEADARAWRDCATRMRALRAAAESVLEHEPPSERRVGFGA